MATRTFWSQPHNQLRSIVSVCRQPRRFVIAELSRALCGVPWVLKVVTEKTKRRKDFGNNKDIENGGNQRRIKLENTLDNFTTNLKIT